LPLRPATVVVVVGAVGGAVARRQRHRRRRCITKTKRTSPACAPRANGTLGTLKAHRQERAVAIARRAEEIEVRTLPSQT
jgi:hypothetical protein